MECYTSQGVKLKNSQVRRLAEEVVGYWVIDNISLRRSQVMASFLLFHLTAIRVLLVTSSLGVQFHTQHLQILTIDVSFVRGNWNGCCCKTTNYIWIWRKSLLIPNIGAKFFPYSNIRFRTRSFQARGKAWCLPLGPPEISLMPEIDHHWTELVDSQYLLLTFFLLVMIVTPGSTLMHASSSYFTITFFKIFLPDDYIPHLVIIIFI